MTVRPAIVRTLRLVRGLQTARHSCRRGEWADPFVLTLLVGLGLTEFSMAPTAIPLATQALRRLHAQDAVRVAARTIRARTAAEVEKLLVDFLSPGEHEQEKQNVEG